MDTCASNEFNGTAIFKRISLSLTLLPLFGFTAVAHAQDFSRHEARHQFINDNPDLSNAKVNRAFKTYWREVRGGNFADNAKNNAVTQQLNRVDRNLQNVADRLTLQDFSTRAEFKDYKQSLRDQRIMLNSNQSVQQINNQIVRVNGGFSLDLTSSIVSITLGNNIFSDRDSVSINVAGQSKTLTAGSKVTAAEYVAVKQALAGKQTVKLDADGRAAGGTVDLSAMTTGNSAMRVDDLVVPESVTAVGDFGRGGDVRISGDLINSGIINAYSSKGSVNALLRADNITNNSNALISSTTSDLTLRADNKFENLGRITSTGNLTISADNELSNSGSVTSKRNLNVLSPNVTNSGQLTSIQGSVTLDTPTDATMLIDNTGGVIAATRGAINFRGADYSNLFSTAIVGGDLLSQTINANSGNAFTDIDVNKLTGQVNSSGYATHVTASTDNLSIGNLDLVDPTFKNSNGNITINGDITVADELAVIASGNITVSRNVSITSQNAGDGRNVTLIAGANVTGPGDNTKKLSGNLIGTTNIATIDGAKLQSKTGGDLKFGSNTSITTSGATAGGVTLIALHGDKATSKGNLSAEGLTINASGTTQGGAVLIIAGGDGDKTVGAIDATGAGGITDGNITISMSQAANLFGTNPIQYEANGSLNTNLGFGQFTDSTALGSGTLTLTGPVTTGNANLRIVSAGDLFVNGNASANFIDIESAGTVSGTGDISSGFSVSNTVAIDSVGSINSTGLISGDVVVLNSQNGNVGTSNTVGLRTDANKLSVHADGGTTDNGNVWIDEKNAVTINALSSAKQQFRLTSTDAGLGDLNIAANVTAGDLLISTSTGSGREINVQAGLVAKTLALRSDTDINLAGDVMGSQSNELTAQGNITRSSGMIVGSTAALVAVNGNIGTSTAGNEISTSVVGLSAKASNGSVYLVNTGEFSITGGVASDTTGTFSAAVKSGSMTVAGDITGDQISLTADNLAGSGIGLEAAVGNAETNSVSISAPLGSFTNFGPVNGTDISINTKNDLTINNAIGNPAVTASVNLTAGGNISGTGFVHGSLLTINTDGNIGTSLASPLQLNITTLDLTMNGATKNAFLENAFYLEVSNAAIGATNSATIVSNFLMEITGPISGNNFDLRAKGDQSDISLQVSPSVNSISLNAGRDIIGTGTINSVNSVSLTAQLGSVGTLANPILVVTPQLTISSGKDAFVNVTTGSTNLNDSIAGTSLNVSVADQLSVTGDLTAPTVKLAAVNGVNVSSTITASERISITNTNSIVTADLASAVLNAPVLELTSTASSIGTLGSKVQLNYGGVLSINAFNTAFVQTPGAITVGGNPSGAGVSFSLEALTGNLTVESAITTAMLGSLELTVNNGNTLAVNADISSGNIALEAKNNGTVSGTGKVSGLVFNLIGGDIGSSDQPLTVDSSSNANFALSASGNVFLNKTGTGSATFGSPFADDLTLVSEGDVIISFPNTILNNLDITASSIKLSSGALNVTGSVNLRSPGALTLDGNIQVTAGDAVNIFALNGDLTLKGQYTFNSDAQLGVLNQGSTVLVDTGAIYTATTTSVINTANLNLQGSLITYTPPNGQPSDTWFVGAGGTYANNSGIGDVVLTGALNFNGNIAIIASGSINLMGITAIDLSGSNQGSLTMLAGYDFEPATNGLVLDRISLFENFTPNDAGGNIVSKSTMTITTSGGDVIAIANAGAANARGTVILGDINTNSNAAIAGGDVTLIGETGVLISDINTKPTSATAGNVIIASAQAILPANFSIINGFALGGAVTVGAATKGLILYNDINAAGANVTITGALETGALSEIFSLGSTTTGVLTVNSGKGDVDLNVVRIGTLNSVSTGSAQIKMTAFADMTLGTISGGTQSITISADNFDVTKTSGTISAGSLSITAFNLSLGTTVSTIGSAVFDTFIVTSGSLGTVNANDITVRQFAPIVDETMLNGLNTSDITLVAKNGTIIGTPGDRFILPASYTRGTFVAETESVYAGSALDSSNTVGFTLGGASSAGKTFDFLAAGNLTVEGDVSANDGNLVIAAQKNQITVADNANLTAKGATSTMFLGVLDESKTARKTSKINIGTGVTLSTDATTKTGTAGLITVSVGAAAPPAPGRKPKNTEVTGTVGTNQVFWGKKGITANANGGVNNFNLQNANVVFNNKLNRKAIVLAGNTTFTPDPPADETMNLSGTTDSARSGSKQGTSSILVPSQESSSIDVHSSSNLNSTGSFAQPNLNLLSSTPVTSALRGGDGAVYLPKSGLYIKKRRAW